MNENNKEKIWIRDMRIKEKFFVDDLYLNGYAKKFGVYTTGVYLSLCRHANKEQLCYPSYETIAEELNISRTQVFRSIKILKENNLIKVKRLGKKLNNRYLLLDKSVWSGRNHYGTPQKHHLVYDRNLHSNDTKLNDTKERSVLMSEAYKNGERRYKPYFWGDQMRWVESKKMWFVIDKDSEWLEFAGKESDIEWKKFDKYK